MTPSGSNKLSRFLLVGIAPWPAIVLVAAFGALLGFYGWRTYAGPMPPAYRLDFGNARWIASSNEKPHGYFRKVLSLPFGGREAFIQIAASDSYTFTVNGKLVGEETMVSTQVSGVYDLTGLLLPGKNVLAVAVKRATLSGPTQLIVLGRYRNSDQEGWKEFTSDATWRVSTRFETINLNGENPIPWTDPVFDDRLWDAARDLGSNSRRLIQPAELEPSILQVPSGAGWLWHPNPMVRAVEMKSELDLPVGTQDAWIGVAMAGGYDLIINGRVVANRILPLDVETTRDLYRVDSFLSGGRNTLAVRAVSGGSVGGILVTGRIVGRDGRVIKLGVDEGAWQVRAQPSGDVPESGAEFF